MSAINDTPDKKKAQDGQAPHEVASSMTAIMDSEYRQLFSALDADNSGFIQYAKLVQVLAQHGIRLNDPRINRSFAKAVETGDYLHQQLDYEGFKQIIKESVGSLIADAIQGKMIIPDFRDFKQTIQDIYDRVSKSTGGKVATYIPQLGRVNPEQFAVSVCTISGQRISIGDSSQYFCIQSISKPVNYCIALELHGEDKVHRHVGREPSGISFNSLSLNNKGLPHNPLINAGAIMTCSLVNPEMEMADRFDNVLDTWERLCGGETAKFNNAVYLSERQTADRNFALGYFMRENKAFPENTDLINTLEFYFQCCSIEVTTDALSVAAATLANGGICPITNEQIFRPDTVKNCLSLMYSCGLYDFSGEFAFTIGLPAKSGVAGGLMIVVPNLLGIAVWSPRLDELGNSVRGIEFCKELVQRFNFHNYDSLLTTAQTKKDPRLKKNETKIEGVMSMCFAASNNDLSEVKQLVARGVDVNDSDYDGRTALHLAASEGHLQVVYYLVRKGANPDARDRWGNCPIDDALRGNHKEIAEYLKTLSE